MIESLVLLLISAPFAKRLVDDEIATRKRIHREASAPAPGLSSQASQIKPVAASKQPYLGPKRPRSAEFYRNRRTKKAIRKLPF